VIHDGDFFTTGSTADATAVVNLKIYEIDPLTCPNCGGTMRVLAFIEEAAAIRKILDHLGLWDIPKRQPKRGREPPVIAVEDALVVYADSQVIEYEAAYYIPDTCEAR
jgi:hypothetical protein